MKMGHSSPWVWQVPTIFTHWGLRQKFHGFKQAWATWGLDSKSKVTATTIKIDCAMLCEAMLYHIILYWTRLDYELQLEVKCWKMKYTKKILTKSKIFSLFQLPEDKDYMISAKSQHHFMVSTHEQVCLSSTVIDRCLLYQDVYLLKRDMVRLRQTRGKYLLLCVLTCMWHVPNNRCKGGVQVSHWSILVLASK